jgi:hypothetical protein
LASTLVRSVVVPGTNLQVNLATQVGKPYDAADIAKDVRYLWSLGRFEDVRAEISGGETCESEGADAIGAVDAVDVVFRVAVEPRYAVRGIRIEPHTFGVAMSLPEGALLTRPQAHQVALDARKQLHERGYRRAKVAYAFAPAGRGLYDLKLTVDTGAATRVKTVEPAGNLGLDRRELRQPLRALRRADSPEALDEAVARLRSLYLLKGYFDASVRATEEVIGGAIPEGRRDVRLQVHIDAGQRQQPSQEPPAVCTGLFAERRDAERRGVLEFPVTLDTPSMTTTVSPSQPYTVGRIDFTSHPHYSDSVIRRHFLLDEGAPLDQFRLRRSIARLNGANLFEPVTERQVSVRTNPKTGTADITVRLTERKRGAWNLSGPVGPMSLAGPLRGSVSSRLPPWGQGLVELSTYTLSFNLFAFSRSFLPVLSLATNKTLFPVVALERPFLPGAGWLSGFAIAPQLGWKSGAAGYAATQIHRRLQPLIAGSRGLVPELPVTVRTATGDATLFCQPPKPRLGTLRTAGGVALQHLAALPAM